MTTGAKDGYYIAIAGPIGVGKTSLAKKLVERWEGTLVAERVDDNPLLAPFYADPGQNAFHLQLYFLIQRAEQQRQILSLRPTTVVVSDYVFAKDELFAHLTLNARQYKLYAAVMRELSPPNVRPDAVIYLRAGLKTLAERIAKRGREFEKGLDTDYMARVIAAYEDFFSSYDRTPLVTVNTEKTDILNDKEALVSLSNQVGELSWEARPEE